MVQLKVRGQTSNDVAKANAPSQVRNYLRSLVEKIHYAGELKKEVDQLRQWIDRNPEDHPRMRERLDQFYRKGLERGEILGDIARLAADLDRTIGMMSDVSFSFYSTVVSWELLFSEEVPF